jgi:hypothetical protein
MRRLDDAGNHRGLFERDILRTLAEVEPRRGFNAVGAVPEVGLIGVQGENFALRVPLFDLYGDKDFADLALGALVADGEADLFGKQSAGQLHRQRAAARHETPAENVAADARKHGRNAQAEVCVEALVFGRDDRVAQMRRDFVVGDDEPPFGRKFRQRVAVRRIHASDRARRVVVQSRNERQVAGVGEHHAAEDTKQRDGNEQGGEPRMTRKTNYVSFRVGHGSVYCTLGSDPVQYGGQTPLAPHLRRPLHHYTHIS